MTFHIIDETNSIDNGLTLNAGDHILVEYDGSVIDTSNDGLTMWVDTDGSTAVINGLVYGGRYGINSVGANNHITVNGLVMGDAAGIVTLSATTVYVGQSGQVSGATGVELRDFSDLVNDGTVNSWDDTAVKMENGDLVNNGLISSFFDAISYGGEWVSTITNTGTIQGNLTTDDTAPVETAQLFVNNSGHWAGSLELSTGADSFTNSGTVTGFVQLGDGGDLLDSRNGSIFAEISGGAGNDTIRTGAEDNTISGGAGGDTLDGGGGNNTLSYLDSVAGVKVNLSNGTARFGDAAGDKFGHFQNLTGSLVTDVLTGTNGDNTLIGAVGADTLTGGGGDDTLQMLGGGNATIDGGDGNDFIQMVTANLAVFGSAFSAANRIDGGSGFDTLELNNTGTVAFANQTVVNVEAIVVQDGFSYGLTTRDATVAAGRTLTVDASLTGANKLDFNGSAETDGAFDIDGGAGKDTFTGGAGADRMVGGGRGDVLTGGGGADVFVYNGLTDSKGVTYDTISDFNAAGVDKLDLDIAVTGFDPTQSGDVSSGTLVFDLQTVVGGNLDASHAILVDVTGGSLSGRLFLLIDGNGNDGYQQNGDYLIDVTGMTGTLSLDDFV